MAQGVTPVPDCLQVLGSTIPQRLRSILALFALCRSAVIVARPLAKQDSADLRVFLLLWRFFDVFLG
jgi:hypothetical protein